MGTELNAIRAMMKAVLTDTSLRELCGTDPQGEVRYRGGGPIEAKPGRHAEGKLGVMFSIVYVLKHEELKWTRQ